MMRKNTRLHNAIKPLVGSIAALLLCRQALAQAGSANWVTIPTDGNWFNSSNWTPATVPSSSTDVASFATSSVTTLSISGFVALDSTVFNSRASAFTINVRGNNSLFFEGAGIANNSGVTQNFTAGTASGAAGRIEFHSTSSAGSNTAISVYGSISGGEGSSTLDFWGNSSAAAATLTAFGGQAVGLGDVLAGGAIYFENDSTGGQAAVQVYGNGFLDISSHNSGSVAIGSLAGNGLVFLGSNNLTVGSNNRSTVFSGVIQDGGEGGGTGGSLTKIGSGTLTLNGANTYTGNTYVNGGTLIVNGSLASPVTYINGGTLGGNGIFGGSVVNSGLLSPGNSPGTVTIRGNYAQNSNGALLIQVASPTDFDRVIVGGSAGLAGTVILAPLNDMKFTRDEAFRILTAGGGVKGTFENFYQPDTGTILKFKVVYEPKDVFIETYVSPFSGLTGLTPNESAVAAQLDRIVNDSRAGKLIDFLSTEPLGNLQNDFDKIAAEEYSSIFALGNSSDILQSLNLQRRTDDLRSGSTGFSASGLAINGINPSFNGPMSFRAGVAGPNGNDGKESKEVKQVVPPENRWGAFLTGTGEWVGVGDDFNARGYDITTGGFTLGVDYKVCPNFAVGLMAGYVGTSVDLNAGGRVLVNGGKLGLYATTFVGGLYADAAVTGGYSSYNLHRAALQGTARGDTDGGDLNVLVGAGYDFKAGAFTFGPTASFNYTYVGMSSFTESGSLAPLHLPSQSQESIRTAFGLKASYDWKVGGVLIKPELRTAWQHEYGDVAYQIDSSFASGAGSTFTVNGPRLGRDSFLQLPPGSRVRRASQRPLVDLLLLRRRTGPHALPIEQCVGRRPRRILIRRRRRG